MVRKSAYVKLELSPSDIVVLRGKWNAKKKHPSGKLHRDTHKIFAAMPSNVPITLKEIFDTSGVDSFERVVTHFRDEFQRMPGRVELLSSTNSALPFGSGSGINVQPNSDTKENSAESIEATTLVASDITEPPKRIETSTSRIVRDSSAARRVKEWHGYRCQFINCKFTMKLPNGRLYAEAHHIRPLGEDHKGVDRESNILCVCPNHHAMLDFGAISLSLDGIRSVKEHRVDEQFVNYHNRFWHL